MIDLGKQWPLNISFFADKCKCLVFANLDATEPGRPLLNKKTRLFCQALLVYKLYGNY